MEKEKEDDDILTIARDGGDRKKPTKTSKRERIMMGADNYKKIGYEKVYANNRKNTQEEGKRDSRKPKPTNN